MKAELNKFSASSKSSKGGDVVNKFSASKVCCPKGGDVVNKFSLSKKK